MSNICVTALIRWLMNRFDTADPGAWADPQSLVHIGEFVDQQHDQNKFREWLRDYVERNRINSRGIDQDIDTLVGPANQRFLWSGRPSRICAIGTSTRGFITSAKFISVFDCAGWPILADLSWSALRSTWSVRFSPFWESLRGCEAEWSRWKGGAISSTLLFIPRGRRVGRIVTGR